MVGHIKLNNHEMNSMASIICLVFLFWSHSLCALVNKEFTDEAETAAVIMSTVFFFRMKHHLTCPLDLRLIIFHFSITLQQAARLPFQNLPQWSHAHLCWLKSSNQGVQFWFLTNVCLYHQSLKTYACQALVTNKALSTTGHTGQIKQILPPSIKYMVHAAFILCKCSDERGFQPEHDKNTLCARGHGCYPPPLI